ncbi:hypothetical protein GGTG_02598 [Gaeumannomyces tritici R3-111a-1]|uniref:Uncharacterized protein n=1 Tax=Gaeumannomyces tritici (strain R3-111a-1) TaxID=644352 RepID=J3NMT9_GAET3|nr:hypothetical protein GGTG_02598 [Gaeumannomyces tritici R3-111a-1]EJT77490.1 hypothetical protein GGTG_02598 [Gaeumannomyces tritici R3-111a-1]
MEQQQSQGYTATRAGRTKRAEPFPAPPATLNIRWEFKAPSLFQRTTQAAGANTWCAWNIPAGFIRRGVSDDDFSSL